MSNPQKVPKRSSIVEDFLYGGRNRGTTTLLPAANETDGPLWKEENCNDPRCSFCPGAKQSPSLSPGRPHKNSSSSRTEDPERISVRATEWAEKQFRRFNKKTMFEPRDNVVKIWKKVFIIAWLISVFIDPLFFFVLSVNEDSKCMIYDEYFAIGIAVARGATDTIYFLHILLQFRIAYVDPESRVVGRGKLVTDPKKVAAHYFRKGFFRDFLLALPLPQVMILWVIPAYWGTSSANFAKNLLRITALLQYVPRMFRVVPMIVGRSSSGFIFESAWSNFVINLLMFVLAGHVVGSCWYLFGLQRVNKCLRRACINSKLGHCKVYLDCINGPWMRDWEKWKRNKNASLCFSSDGGFKYGIYKKAPNVTKDSSVIVRYFYSLFWGFQQISTLAGNQEPSEFFWEILFIMSIIGLGLLLFALLIGNMHNFLLSLGKRRLEMQLRRRDVEHWMSHRRFPKKLMQEVRVAEKFSWSLIHRVNEEKLMENLPKNLQKDIRRHLFSFIKEVKIFSLLDEPVLDAIHEVLEQKLYPKDTYVQQRGRPIDKIVFIVHGEMSSIDVKGNSHKLKQGDIFGEELLAWHLEASSLRKTKDMEESLISRLRLLSTRDVRSSKNVEAFTLQSSDLEDIIEIFKEFMHKPHIQGAIRYASTYWRSIGARHIQIVWRYIRWKRMRKLRALEYHHNLS